MHHYELHSRYGDYAAYRQDALKVRAHEMEALAEMSKNNDLNIAVKAAVRQVQNQADTVKRLATHPVKTVTGIPRGIAHLFGGYKAQAGEVVGGLKTDGHDSNGSTASHLARSA